MDYKRIWQKINGRQKDSFTFSLFYRVRLFICSIYIDSSVYDCGTRIGSQILFSLFFSLTDTHTHSHSALIDAGRDPTTLAAGRLQSPLGHSAVKLQCGHVAGGTMMRQCCTMKEMMNFWVGGNYSPALVLPSGTQSPLAWSRCSLSETRCWNEATGGADSPTKAENNSPRPPSWCSCLPALTSLYSPIPHRDTVKETANHCIWGGHEATFNVTKRIRWRVRRSIRMLS